MAQFEAAVRGISDACRALRDPGRLRKRLLLQRDGRPRDPADADRRDGGPARGRGEARALAVPRARATRSRSSATTRDELGGSEFLRTVRGPRRGAVPGGRPRRRAAARRRSSRISREEGRLASAHDLSDGGLAVALAECAMSSGLGADGRAGRRLRARRPLLFGESTGRALISFSPGARRPPSARAAGAGGRPLRSDSAASAARGSRSPQQGRVLLDEDLDRADGALAGRVPPAIESADLL